MNNVSIVGRFARDPEVRYTDSGIAVARFTVAVNRQAKDGVQSADFISCIAFGKTAEFIERYFSKGKAIGITGRIQTGSYEKEGTKVYTTDVVADRVEFVGNKEGNGSGGQSAPVDGHDIPEGFSALDDDVPF